MSAALHGIARRSSRMGLTFTGEALDRAAEHRGDPAWLAAQAADPAARAVLAGDAGVHVTAGEEPRLALLPLAHLDAREPLLLGRDGTGPVFAVDADPDGGPHPVIAARGEGPPDS